MSSSDFSALGVVQNTVELLVAEIGTDMSRCLASRRDRQKALIAVAHRIVIALYHKIFELNFGSAIAAKQKRDRKGRSLKPFGVFDRSKY